MSEIDEIRAMYEENKQHGSSAFMMRMGDVSYLLSEIERLNEEAKQIVDHLQKFAINLQTEVEGEQSELQQVNHASIVWKPRHEWVQKLEVQDGKIVDGGHWIEDEAPYCSNCNGRLDERWMQYCPKCGAKLDLEAQHGAW